LVIIAVLNPVPFPSKGAVVVSELMPELS